MSLITWLAIIIPATGGTNDILPGVCLLGFNCVFSSSSTGPFATNPRSAGDKGFIGISSEYTTFNFSTPLFLIHIS